MIRISDQNLLTQYIMAHQYDDSFNLSFVKNVQKMFKVYCNNIADQKYKYNKNALIHTMREGIDREVC